MANGSGLCVKRFGQDPRRESRFRTDCKCCRPRNPASVLPNFLARVRIQTKERFLDELAIVFFVILKHVGAVNKDGAPPPQ